MCEQYSNGQAYSENGATGLGLTVEKTKLKRKNSTTETQERKLHYEEPLLNFVTLFWMLSSQLQVVGQLLMSKLNTKPLLRQTKLDRNFWKFISQPLVATAVFVFLLLFYVGVPIWFYFCPWFRRHAVFLNVADWPLQDFRHPEAYGLKCTRNFYIETAPDVILGVWHILPTCLHRDNCSEFQDLTNYSFMNDNRPIVLYLHGSAESRTAAYRRSMYRVLTSNPLDFHVISFDYRGFGDSTYVLPTVTTLVSDAEAMYNWLRTQVPASRIYLWGHSLGTGIAIRLGEITNPKAVVLEAPFASVADATHTFPLSFFHRGLPFFQNFCADRTKHADTNLDSVRSIGKVHAPILILHAADDTMVWSTQGKRLFSAAVEQRPKNTTSATFAELDGKYGCGHRNIHKAPELPGIVTRFIDELDTTTAQTDKVITVI